MADSETTPAGGPQPGQSAEELSTTLREAAYLLTDDSEDPRSMFLALRYENGTDFVHGHAAAHDADLDGKVYDLFAPLAVHVEQVAEAANTDPATVLKCLTEFVDAVPDPDLPSE